MFRVCGDLWFKEQSGTGEGSRGFLRDVDEALGLGDRVYHPMSARILELQRLVACTLALPVTTPAQESRPQTNQGKEPIYQGKPLSYWIQRLQSRQWFSGLSDADAPRGRGK